MLKLYRAGNSICTQKVLMTLHEKELDFDSHEVNLFKNEQYDPAYLKLNPKGVVPTLDHDGRIVVESTLICAYLDDVFPEKRLIPDDAYARVQVGLWAKAIDEGIFEATRELSFSAMFRERLRNMTEEQRQQRFRNVGDPERQRRYVSTYEEGVESPYVLAGIYAYEKLFKNMTAALDGNDWLLGDRFSMADLALTPFVARLHYLDLLDVWIAERPAIRTWFERMQARPSYAFAIGDALTDTDVAEMAEHGGKIRDRVAERRAEYLAAH